MIELQQKRRENEEKHLSRFDMIKLLTPLKKEEEYKWLNEISNTSLQITCTDLSKAYKKDLKLSDRVYRCEHCGSVIDRDFNAALNLERYVG